MPPHKHMKDLTHSVNKLSRLFSDYVQREMMKSGHGDFHATTAFVLLPLLERDGLTLSDLARDLHMKAPTITVIANRLEAKGLIRRERGKSDRRQVHLFLTKHGKQTAKIIESIQGRASQSMSAGLDVDSISLTKSTLEKIIANVGSSIHGIE